jgi:hypothetical protein
VEEYLEEANFEGVESQFHYRSKGSDLWVGFEGVGFEGVEPQFHYRSKGLELWMCFEEVESQSRYQWLNHANGVIWSLLEDL